MLKILIMTPHDIEFAVELTKFEGWHYTDEDFSRLLFLEPTGLYVAWKDRERAGIISTITYGNYAFIGTLIVKSEFRKHGIGKELMAFAIKQLQESGVTSIELDGVFDAVDLYRSLGFQDKYLSYRLVKQPGEKSDNTLLYQPQDFSDIIDFDFEMTGLDRSVLLNRYIEEFNDRIVMLKKRNILSYALIKPLNKKKLRLSSFISKDKESAEVLLNSVLKSNQHKTIYVGVPEPNRRAVDLFTNKNFEYSVPSLRMYLGNRIDYEKHMYGIISPEKG